MILTRRRFPARRCARGLKLRPLERNAISARVLLPATLAGRYQLVERLGEGGMGDVWRCFDLDLEDFVAIKFMRAEYAADESLCTRFRREVRLARRVTHSNVARVYEFGHADGLLFLTMEFIAGGTLYQSLTREGTLSPARVAAMALSLCRGLAAAHAAGVVHGDIKPSNIMMEPERGAVLTDFGIATALSEAPNASDGCHGTLDYMSPEHVHGLPLTPTSDVFAVGVVLFEALTGHTPLGHDPVALMDRHAGDPDTDVSQLAPGLPTLWAGLINDCLRNEPLRRPCDGSALLVRLAALRDPELADAASKSSRAPLAGNPYPKWIEVVPFVDGAGASEWLTGDLVEALSQVRAVRVVQPGTDTQETAIPTPGLLNLVAQIRGDVQPAADGVTVSVHIADRRSGAPLAAFTLEQPRAALPSLGIDLAARIVASLDPQGVATKRLPDASLEGKISEHYLAAQAALHRSRLDEALGHYEEALVLAPGDRQLQLRRTLARVKAIFVGYGPPNAAALDDLRVAVDAAVLEHADRGEPHLAQASIALALNEPFICARAARRAIACAPSLAPAHVLVAGLQLEIGRLLDAERHIEIALALDRRNTDAWTHRARLLAYQGRWDGFHATIDGPLTTLGCRSPHLARLMLWEPERRALERLEQVYAANADHLPPALCLLAREIVAFGLERDDRRAILERLLAHPSLPLSPHTRFIGELQCELACVVGDLERARALLMTADEHTLIDWTWIEQCPLIAPLRSDPGFPAIRARVRDRADLVAQALWD